MIQFKEGVQLTATEAINKILCTADFVYGALGVACWVTAGRDGQHMKESKHYTNEALDLRIRDFKLEDLQSVVQSLQKRLGQDFDVVLEHDHLHIEFDPKKG